MQPFQSTIVRTPTWADLPQFLTIGRALHQESWFRHLKYDENRIADFFYRAMMDPDENFCRIADSHGELTGAIAGKTMIHWFSGELGVFDTFFYVRPERRGTTLAFRLWREMRDWATTRGAVELTHGVATAIATEKSHRFFTGVGMEHVGGIYKLRLSPIGQQQYPLSASERRSDDHMCLR